MSSYPYPDESEDEYTPVSGTPQPTPAWIQRDKFGSHSQLVSSVQMGGGGPTGVVLAPGMVELADATVLDGLYTERTRFVECFDVVHLCIGFMNLTEAHNIRFVSRVWHDAAQEHMEGQRGKIRKFVITYNEDIERKMNKTFCLSQHKKLEWLAFNVSCITLSVVPWLYWYGVFVYPWNIPRLAALVLFFFSLVLAAPLYFWYFVYRMERSLNIMGPFFSALVFILLLLASLGYALLVLFPEVTRNQETGKYYVSFPVYWIWFAQTIITLNCTAFIAVPLEIVLTFLFLKDGVRIHTQQIRNPLSQEYHENTIQAADPVKELRQTSSVVIASPRSEKREKSDDPWDQPLPGEEERGDKEEDPQGSKDSAVWIGRTNTEDWEGGEDEEVAAIAKNNDNQLPCFVGLVARYFLRARKRVTIKEVVTMMEKWEATAK